MGSVNKKVRLFALSTCPHCKKARHILENYNVEHEVIEVDTLDSGEQWLMTKELRKYNPNVTFPTMVVEEVVIGADEERIKEILGIQ